MAIEFFDASNAMQTVNRLCAVSHELLPSASPYQDLPRYLAASRARLEVLTETMRGFGYGCRLQTFRHKRRLLSRSHEAANALFFCGDEIAPRSALIIGHHDYCAGLGAEDNGAALGVIAELARLFRGCNRLCFASFDLEELGCAGSTRFVKSLSRAEFREFEWVICLECLGSGKDLVACQWMCDVVSDPHLVSTLVEAANAKGHELPVHGFDCFYSDHFPFAARGAKTVELGSIDLAEWKGMSDRQRRNQFAMSACGARRLDGSIAHTVFDRPENIQQSNLQKAGDCLVETIRLLIGASPARSCDS